MTIVTSGVNRIPGYPGVMTRSRKRERICSGVVEILRTTRESKGISMTELADRAGLSRSIISLVERELRNPTLDTLLRISQALGVSLGEVIARSEAAVESSS